MKKKLLWCVGVYAFIVLIMALRDSNAEKALSTEERTARNCAVITEIYRTTRAADMTPSLRQKYELCVLLMADSAR